MHNPGQRLLPEEWARGGGGTYYLFAVFNMTLFPFFVNMNRKNSVLLSILSTSKPVVQFPIITFYFVHHAESCVSKTCARQLNNAFPVSPNM